MQITPGDGRDSLLILIKEVMIVRQWRGLAKKDKEVKYIAHFHEEVLPTLRQLAGFRGVTVLRREIEDGIEVTVLTRWNSLDAVKSFAGENAEVAVVAEAAQPCFSSYDKTVSHHEVLVEEI